MSSIQTGIELNDQFSGVLNNIISSVNLAVSAMYDMQQSMNADIDTSSIEGARDEINQATAAIEAMNQAASRQTAPDIAPPVVDGGNQEPISVPVDPVLPDPLVENPEPIRPEIQPNAPPDPEPVEIPVTWNTDGVDVFTGTGVERFQQEVQSANDMLNTLNTTQARISQTAQGMDILPDAAVQDMNTMQQRLSAIQQRIQQIENNPVNVGADNANAELEQLRMQLNQAIQEQNSLNQAMQNMDVSAANDAYLRLSQTVGNTERYIRDNVDEQGRFNQEISAGTQQANELTNTIKRAVAAYVSIQSVGKALNISDELVQTTSRLNMMNDGVQTTAELVNMVYAAAQDANNQLLSEVDGTMTKDYTYDNRGNLLKVSTGADILKEFTFDATNQMTASFDLVDGQRKKATYTYNGLGHRVGQKISSLIPEYPEKKIRYTIDMTRQYYNLLQKSEGGASQTYYWDGNVVGMESNGVEKFYLQDDFGSPMHLVDIYGTSQECFAFDEFGENLSTSYNNTSQTFGFTGYQTDEVGDLYYAQARRYDASVGRFVSEDKVRGFVILPYTLNHYGYCWNNPVDFVDRDGNLPTVVIGAVIGLAAGALGEVVSQTIDGVQSGKSVLDSLLDVNPGKVVLEAGKGAVTGAVAGTGAGLLVVAGTSGVVEFGGDLLDQKVLQKKEDLDYTHAISNGLWSATTTLVVGGITNEISNVIHPEAKTGTMDYLFGRDKAKAVVKAQYNNARSSSSRAKYWNRLEKIKLQKTLGTIKYGIIETGKTIIDEIKNEIYRDEVNEDIVEEIDKKISCSVY